MDLSQFLKIDPEKGKYELDDPAEIVSVLALAISICDRADPTAVTDALMQRISEGDKVHPEALDRLKELLELAGLCALFSQELKNSSPVKP